MAPTSSNGRLGADGDGAPCPRLALDVLSPLPPVRSGISDYTVDLLPHLAARADVRVVALPDQPVDPEVAARWQPVGYAEAGYGDAVADRPAAEDVHGVARARPRLPLYQMGNNEHHLAVEDAARRHPGVLVLHDVVLHHLLLTRTMGRDLYAPYEERLLADHGALGRLAARPLAWGVFGQAAMFALPAHRTLLRSQRGVLVHSRWAAERIAEDDPQVAVRSVPMPIPLPALPDLAAVGDFRARLGLPPEALVLGSFGFQTPIKRPEVALAALAAPALADVHLLVVGQASEELDLDGLARAAGVRDRVHILGFLPFAELETAIAAADLCLNLRYPTAGETSASLLRVLALGRPAIVSRYAQFAELPPEVALQVPVGEGEVPALVAALASLVGDPERAAAMGLAARAHVAAAHDPERAADAIVAACGVLAGREPPAPEVPPSFVPTSHTWSNLPIALTVDGAEAPWAGGTRRELRIAISNRGPARLLAGRRGAGGVAFEVAMMADGADLLAGRAWPDLPRDLDPGESAEIRYPLRRPLAPPGTVTLRVAPHVLGRSRIDALQLGEPTAVAGEPEPPRAPPTVIWEERV